MTKRTPRTNLVLALEVETPSLGDDFYHINAGLHRPKGDTAWADEPANGFYIRDLMCGSQGSRSEDHVYATGVRYRDIYKVDVRDAERMLKTLKKVERGMHKLAETYGYPQDFAGVLVHFARVVGATHVRWNDANAPLADEHGVVQYEISDWRIRGFVNLVVAKYGKPTEDAHACA